jgi:hypothetical protein
MGLMVFKRMRLTSWLDRGDTPADCVINLHPIWLGFFCDQSEVSSTRRAGDAAMSTSFPETQNREWGFFGTISRHGRHFADEVSDDPSRGNILRQAANLKDPTAVSCFRGF